MATSPHPRRSGVTRQDVADLAGVSSAVVSYVVNSGPRNVAPETRDRVLDAIQELQYRPNATARALKRGVSEIIGLVISDNTNPYFAEFARAIERAAATKGLSIIFINSAGTHEHEDELVGKMLSRQVDGLLWASNEDHPDVAGVQAAGISLVLLDRARPMPGVASLGVNFREASRVAVEHLIGHGHKSVALICGDAESVSTTDRRAGWSDALEAADLEKGPIVFEQYTREGGYIAGKAMMAMTVVPTAIYVTSDLQAVGLLRALHEHGVRVPEDVAVVTFDGSVESEFTWPPLTAMHQPVIEMAAAAIDALTAREQVDLHHISFTADLVIRESCGCVPT
ncbi:LacI family DNA-binding transcriptional regulator [Salinibacterium sp. G-O1]|uniref:LacI family DNA-binding transcriptional regulator n=1 Tax=Salinibacterium sp. G-O1 TaxID=3046208 RepID=UPI0024B96754|nr:LacI family DNA-binding transcriptional regulator [Salinibacterium sp. G-O1]MDJ0334330.1 LacI family DNA-binding transcriptional regulator [Salinibacterium sp. G-O1]